MPVTSDDWIMHPIDREIRVSVCSTMPVLEPATDQAIEELWRAAQARLGGCLFNGLVFCADRIGSRLIEGHWTEFRRVVAQFENPAMFEQLRVRSLAINGAVIGPQGVVVGRRPARALYQANLWQLAPAGSVDPSSTGNNEAIDVMAQAASELGEELGMSFSEIETAIPIGLVEHASSHVCDLGIAMTTSLSAEAILATHESLGNGEYSALEVVGRHQIADFVASVGDGLARQSCLFLQRMGWLRT